MVAKFEKAVNELHGITYLCGNKLVFKFNDLFFLIWKKKWT